MPTTLPVMHGMNNSIEFQTAIRGHHIYKDVWVPGIGQNLVCKTDTQEEAMEYDKNAIGVFKSDDPETVVGHLPIEISCLLTYFLEASPENKLNAIVIGKRKLEVGLVVPAKYAALTKNKTFANVLAGRLQEKKRKHRNFEFEITTATVTKVVTNVKYEKTD